MIREKDLAPDFTLLSDAGEQVTLSNFLGRKVVLYFYPQDDTPGCVTEACAFRDDQSLYLMKGAVVIGVSPDDSTSHNQFRAKYGLSFYLLSDTDHRVAEMYGAWGEKQSQGQTVVGLIRSTFVIDEDGKIVKAFYFVNPAGHSTEVLQYL